MNFFNLTALCLSLGITFSHAASSYGNLGLGSENSPYSTSGLGKGQSGEASVNGKSYHFYNTANMAYNEWTVFDVTFGLNSTLMKLGDSRGVQNGFSLKNIQMSIPMGEFGNLSAAYYQSTQSEFKSKLQSNGFEGDLTLEGGLSEIVPGYAYGLTDKISLGLTYHLVSGQQRWMLEQGLVSNSTDPRDSLIASQATFIGEYKVLNSGSYPGFSAHFHEKMWDVAVFYHGSAQLERSFEANQYFAQDSVYDSRGIPAFFTNKQVREVELPWKAGLAISVEPMVGQEFSADYIYSAEGDSYTANPYLDLAPVLNQASHQWGLGWERKGSGRGYDSYLNKTVLRAGYFGKTFKTNDELENGVSLGLGLPLGRRGAMIDISYGFAYRGSGSIGIAEEFEQSIYFSFTGLGKWGEPSRRYR